MLKTVLLPKPMKNSSGNNNTEIGKTSSRSVMISLLPVIKKLLDKSILNRMRKHLAEITPSHQFGFREGHGSNEQVHRLIDVMSRALQNKQYCFKLFNRSTNSLSDLWRMFMVSSQNENWRHKCTTALNYCGCSKHQRPFTGGSCVMSPNKSTLIPLNNKLLFLYSCSVK